jgi:hypothetical protein
MGKTVVVVFKDTGARILVNPELKDYEQERSYVVNPDLSAMAGIPPHEWRLDGDRICAFHPEKGEIEAVQEAPAPEPDAPQPRRVHNRRIKWVNLILCAHSLAIIFLIVYTLTK